MITLVALAVPAAAWFMLQPTPNSSSVPPDDTHHEFPEAPVRDETSILVTAEQPGGVAKAAAPVPESATVPLRIEMAATGLCWVAAEIDGERVTYRLVEPGERLMLEAEHLISVRLGDAGAVTLSINDGPHRSLGGDGEVAELEVTLDNVDGLSKGAVNALSDAGA
jgi:hypothetical protein